MRQTPNQSTTSSIGAGDWVQINSADEIIATLDQNSQTAGVPFMPEMAELCGHRLQIRRVVGNVCTGTGVGQLSDCYVLNTQSRCDGSGHGGCQMGCRFIWQLKWLTPLEHNDEAVPKFAETVIGQTSMQQLIQISSRRVRPANKSGDYYVCQATQLQQLARRVSVSQFKQYKEAFLLNRLPLSQIVSYVLYLIRKKIIGKKFDFVGNLKRTPVVRLDLQIGQSVKVKTAEQIRQTLDAQGCNRGLWFDHEEMSKYCGKTMTVSRRIDTIIDEETGELLNLKTPSVVLSETECSGFYRRFCSRGMLFMWRESWLERP